MFILYFEDVRFISKSAQIQLPRPNLVLDPRVSIPNDARFHYYYHDDGITVTITTDHEDFEEEDEDEYSFHLRVYDPSHETIPDFDSTIYTYMGRDNERAPADTTIGIIDPSVKTIKVHAFNDCSMKKCIIHGGVETIEMWAFCDCISLEALFLPSSIKTIDDWTFLGCRNIRILSIPTDIDISQVKEQSICFCDTLFHITQIPRYQYSYFCFAINNDQVHQALIDFYRNASPLHRACLDVNVSAQTIHDCIIAHGSQAASIIDHDGMTPLHILSLNPHATVGSIQECVDAAISASFVADNRGNTPLDYLKENNLDAHTWIVTALCMYREAAPCSPSESVRASSRKMKRKRIGLSTCVDFFLKLSRHFGTT